MRPINPTIVIVGITGDLAEKKLLPALYALASRSLLHDDTILYGTSRRAITTDEIIEKLQKPAHDTVTQWLSTHLKTITADVGTKDGSRVLADALGTADNVKRLFYLSIPPDSFGNVIESMAHSGLNTNQDHIVVEKPFGWDTASAQALHEVAERYFNEENIYRVDHYLAKPGVRHLVEREPDALNPQTIRTIDVRSDEELDIQGRGNFFEQTGTLRDVVQSHLLQVLAECIADKADANDAIKFHRAKERALASLHVVRSYRAQYEGYRREVNNQKSMVETYASLELTSDIPAWQHVHITVRSGKALPDKISDVTITYQDSATKSFDMNKNPDNVLEGYEQIIYDAATANCALFLTAREVNLSWKIVEDTLKEWSTSSKGLEYYEKGTIPDTNI